MREDELKPIFETHLQHPVVYLAFAVRAESTGDLAGVAPFASDSCLICGESDGHLSIWTIDGNQVREAERFVTSAGSLYQLAVHPQGTLVATAGQGEVTLWQLPHATQLDTFRFEPGERFQAIAFAPHGDMLLVASDREVIRAIDLASGSVVQTFPGGERNPSIACHPAGNEFVHLACFQGGSVISASQLAGDTDLPENKPTENRITTTCDALYPGSFSPDGTLYACSDRHVRVYRYPSFERVHAFDLYGNLDPEPRDSLYLEARWSNTVFSPDGRSLLAGSPLGTLFSWNLRTGSIQHQWPAHRGGVLAMASDPTGRLFASSGQDRSLKLWALPSTELQ